MSRTSKITLAVALLLLLLGALALHLRSNETAIDVTYALTKVERGDLLYSISATGTLSPLITVQVGSQVSGTIEEVYVDFNSKVKKGQIVAQIEPALFRAQVAQAQANYESSNAVLDKARVIVEDARRQLERAKDLQKKSMMAESDIEAAQFNFDAAVVETRVKKAAVAQAKATLDQAQVNLANTTIYTPIEGVVLSKDVDVGQTVAASLQAPTLFTIAQDLRHMQIETNVDEAFIGMVHEGQTVTFSVFAYPQDIFEGKLVQIRLSPQSQDDSDVVLYNCIIEVDNTNLKLKPRMTATVTIQVDARQDILKVPNSALRYMPDLPAERIKELRQQVDFDNNEALIWTPSADGAVPIKVILGLSSDHQTEVSAEGLIEGMEIIIGEKDDRSGQKRKTGIRLF
jgi:HlyD family secretion protein